MLSNNNVGLTQAVQSIARAINEKSSTDWIDITTFYNSWSNYGSVFPPARYRKDRDGFVHLSGLIKGGTTSVGTTLFYLPAGYYPTDHQILLQVLNISYTVTRMDIVHTTGQVKIGGGSWSAGWTSLEGVCFYAG